jgi:hypothetical protein
LELSSAPERPFSDLQESALDEHLSTLARWGCDLYGTAVHPLYSSLADTTVVFGDAAGSISDGDLIRRVASEAYEDL